MNLMKIKDSKAAIEFLNEAEQYFKNRPTNGEDRAYWANVYNAENCFHIAELIKEKDKEIEKWKKLDSEAATHVESLICMKSHHFTGDEPYVGWKGLGLALNQDYDELKRLLILKEAIWAMASSRYKTVDAYIMVAKQAIAGYESLGGTYYKDK